MKLRSLPTATALLWAATCLPAQTTLYWDSDGTTAGTTNIRNTWDYSVSRPWWSTSSAGDVATQSWVSGYTAVFSAGTNATGYQLVDIGQAVNVSSIYVEEGDVELWGAFYSGYFHDLSTFDVASGATAILDATMNESSGTVNFTKTGVGTLTIKAPNNMTGNFTVSGGTVNITSQGNLSSGNLTVNNGATLANTGVLELNSRTVNVTGSGSTLSSTNYIEFGDIGDVTANVYDGAVVSSDSSIAYGVNAGVNGVGLVSGAGSQLNSGSQIHVGYYGIGELTVESGGRVTPGSILELATYSGSTGTFNLNSGGTLAIGGAHGIAKGAGTANLNFGGGTVEVTGANLTTIVPVTLVGGTDSTIDTNGFTAAFSGGMDGAGSLTKSGTGSLYLYGASYTGSTTVDEGTLYNTLNNLPSGTALTINSPGTFDLAGYTQTVGSLAGSGSLILGGVNLTTGGANTDTTFSGVISGTGGFTKTGTGTQTLTGANTYTGVTTISGGTLLVGNGATAGSIASTGITNNGNFTTNRSDDVTYAAVISGSGSVTQAGTGNTTLSGNNTYSGGTIVDAGTLTLGHANALGATTGNLTLNGGTLNLGTNDPTVGTAVFNGGTFTNGTLDNAAAFEVRTGSLANDLDGDQTLTKTGSGTFTLSGTNTYTGDTTVSDGILQVGSVGNIGSGDLNISGGSLSSTGNLVLNRTVTVDGAGSALSTATYLEIGDGATGSLTVSDGGAVTSGSTAAFGHQAGITGTGTLTGSGSSFTSDHITYLGISGTGTLNLEDGATLNAPSALLGVYAGSSGTLNINGGTLNVPSLSVGQSGVGNLNINDGGTISNTSITAGSSGRINVNDGGILDLGSSNGVVIQNSGSPVYLNQGGTIQVSGVNPTFGGNDLHVFGGTLQVVDSDLTSGVNFIIGDAGTWWTDLDEGLTVDTNGFDATLAGGLGRVSNGRANVTKIGEGTLTLTAANTYSGSTHINGGTLAIANQSNLSTGAIYIRNGAHLTSSGSLPFDRYVYLTGAGSSLYTSGYFEFGSTPTTGSGPLYLYDGASAEAASTVAFGTGSGASGSADISGSGSTLTSGAELYLGISGSGTVDVASGGTINAPHIILAYNSGSVGILNLYSGGTVNVGVGGVDIGSGSGSALNLRGGTLNFTATNSHSSAPIGVVTGTTSTINTNAFDATIGGVMAGGGSLIKTGSGTLTLAGANSYTGTTTLSEGTLQVGAGGTTGELASDVVNNANLTFNRSDALAYSGVISGSGSVTQAGSGNTTLSGNNTYTGGTTVDAGTLTLDHANALGATTGDLTLNGGTLDLGTNSPTIGTAIFNGGTFTNGSLNNASAFEARTGTLDASLGGSTGLTKTGSGTFTFTGDQTYTGTTTVSDGTLRIGDGTTTGSVASSSIVNNATLAFDRSNTLAAANNISGSGSVTQSGSGTLTLSGTNTYAGGTTVNGGTLNVTDLSNLGSGDITVSNGADLHATGGLAYATDRDVSVSGAGSTFSTDGYMWFGTSGGATTNTVSVTDGGSLSTVQTISLADAGSSSVTNLTVSGTDSSVAATGNLYVGYAGNGTATVADGGTLSSAAQLSIATTAGSNGTLNLNSGGTIQARGTNGIAIGAGTGAFNANGGTLQVVSADLTTAAAITLGSATNSTVDTNGLNATLSGNLSGDGALTKTGSGTLTLSGTNSYAGGTTVSGGALTISSDAKLGAGSGALAVTNGATLNTGGDFRTNRAVTIDGSGSNLSNNGELIIGNGGNGSLTLTDGGSASTYNLTLAFGGGTGTVNIGDGSSVTVGNVTSLGSATSNITLGDGGTLTTASLGGSGTFDFAGGTLVAGGAFTSGMSGTLTNASTVNTNGNAVTLSGNLSSTGSLTKTGTGNLTLSGTNSYSGGTTVSAGTLSGNTTSLQGNIINNSAVTFDQSSTGTYAGDMSGTGSFTKSGAGNLTLSGTNTYAGGTTLSGGTLTISSDAKLGASSGALAVSSGATLATGGDFRTNRAVTIDGSGSHLANNGELIIGNGGTGSLTFTEGGSASTYNLTLAFGGGTGTVDIGDGSSVSVGNLTALGSGTSSITVGSGGTLTTAGLSGSGTLNLTGGTLVAGGSFTSGLATILANASTIDTNGHATTLSGNLSGDGSLTKSGAGNLTLAGANGYSGGTTISAGSLTGNTTSLQGDIANNATVVFDQAASGTYAGAMTGSGSLAKTGVGNLTLSGSNSYAGGTTVSAGTLSVSSDANLGSTAGALAVNSGAAFNAGTNFQTNRAITLDGSGTSLTTGNGELVIGSAGTGSLALTNNATAAAYNLTLGLNGGTGTVEVSSGSAITVNNNTSLSGSSVLNLNTGGTLTTSGLTGSGAVNLAGGTLRSGGAFSSSLPATLSNASTINTNGHATTLSGNLSGDGSFTKSGAGTLTLSGDNSYAGGTTVAAGTLSGDTGSLQGDITNNAAVVFDQAATGTYAGAISGDGSFTKSGNGTLILTGANTLAGGTTVSAGTLQLGNGTASGSVAGNITNNGAVVFNRHDDATYGGVISGTGGVTMDGYILRFSGAQTYTGATSVKSGGYLVLANDVNQGLSAATTVDLESGAFLDISNHATEIAGLTGAGRLYSFIGEGDSAAGHLTINTTNGQNQTFSGVLGGADHNNFALTKSGEGSLTLSGTNTYTGTTTVEAGTLLVNGSNASSTFTVNGGTLGGTGTIGALTVNSGGTLAPGSSPGILNVTGNLILNSGSIIAMELAGSGGVAGTDFDQIVATGTMTAGGTLNVTAIDDFTPSIGQSFQLFNASSIGGTFAAVNLPSLTGATWNTSSLYSTGTLSVVTSAVPEPGSFALLAGLGAVGFVACRRRRF